MSPQRMRPWRAWRLIPFAVTAALAGSARGADAQTATLYLNSQPGDYIGAGQQQTYTIADGVFQLSTSNAAQHVSVAFHTQTYSHWWYLDFAAPSGTPLTSGQYEGATRYPFQSPVGNGLDVAGDGRGCNELTGRFVVLEAAYDNSGNVLKFAADLEQHCEGGNPALFGSIRYNSAVTITPRISVGSFRVLEGDAGVTSATFMVSLSEPSGTPVSVAYATTDGTAVEGADYHGVSGTVSFAPGQVSSPINVEIIGNTTIQPDHYFTMNLSAPAGAPIAFGQGRATIVDDDSGKTFVYMVSQPGDYIGLGHTWMLTPIEGTFTASLDGNLARVYYRSDTWFDFHLQAPSGSPLVVGAYENATRWPFQAPDHPGLDASGDGRGCNTSTGRFVVLELELGSGGEVVRFAADFEQHCEGQSPALFGYIRFNSLAPLLIADLSITKSDGVAAASPGQPIAYTITVANAGPAAVTGAIVNDTVLAALDGVHWTCGGLGGGHCPSSGNGNIAAAVDLPVGATVTFTLQGTISPSATGSINNTASVTAPGGVADPNPANNAASDTDTLVVPCSPCTPGIADGTFEAGNPWVGWTTQFSSQFGTPICEVSLCGTGNGTAAPYAGSNWAWFGGTPFVPETAVLGQRVTLPVTTDLRLRFQMRVGFVTPPLTDTLVVSVDGVPLRTFGEPAAAEPGYTPREVSLTAFANGGMHTVLFTYTHLDEGTANFTIDNVELVAAPVLADLSILNSDGRTSAASGGPITYTIVASNAGPTAVSGAKVSDALPAAITGATWTCVGAGGATCAPSGTGGINDTVNLPVGGAVTYLLSGTIAASATDSLTNTAFVSPPAGIVDPDLSDNSATDVDLVGLPADLHVTITDGQTTASPGQVLTYTIVAGNDGPNGVTGATVANPLPAALTGATWTCSASGGAACAASGTGDVADTVNLPPGASVTYTLTATVSAAPASVRNTVTISAPAGIADVDPSDNSATDDDLLICDSYVALVPDGRLVSRAVAGGANVWFVAPLRSGASYSAEFQNLLDSGPPTVTLFAGADGCTGNSSLVTRDTTLIDPVADGSAVRVSFVAGGSDPYYRIKLAAPAGPANIWVGLAETTLFSAAWSTNGGFNTFYSLQNTTGGSLSGTLTLLDTSGTTLATFAVTIPAGQTSSTNTASLGVTRNRTGTARFTHDGPPGSVVAEAAIANFSISPAYVQPVKVQTVREGRK